MPDLDPRPEVLSIGSVNADFQMRIARSPAVSETLPARDFVRLGGGKAANVAYLACRLGVPARLIAHVGDDDLAEQALAPLIAAGVDVSGVKKLPGRDTGLAVVLVPPDGKKGIVLAANANEAWVEDDMLRVVQAIREAPPGSVLAGDCEVPGWVLEQALRSAREQGLATVLDPSPAAAVGDALLSRADIVTPNAGEAGQLTGIECKTPPDALEAARRLRARGARAAAVKLPDGGCVYVDATCAAHIGALTVDVVDTTGAGDAFAGALAAMRAGGASWLDAVHAGVAAAHLAVGAYGSQPSYPTRQQIERMMQRLPVDQDVG